MKLIGRYKNGNIITATDQQHLKLRVGKQNVQKYAGI